MSQPTHVNPKTTRKERKAPGTEFWAHAPYNFVPLPDQVVQAEQPIPDQDRYSGKSGYFECVLTTQTPLYIRGLMTERFFKTYGEQKFWELPPAHKNERAEFFSLNGRPVLLGSSLRGMLRALFEIVTYAKVQPVTAEPLVFRAFAETASLGDYYRGLVMHIDRPNEFTPLMRAGYIHKGRTGWQIQPAREKDSTTFARIRTEPTRKDEPFLPFVRDDQLTYLENGEPYTKDLEPLPNCRNAFRIWVKAGSYAYQNVRGRFLKIKYAPVVDARVVETEGFEPAVVAFSGRMNKKRHEAVIYAQDDMAAPLEIDARLTNLYRDQVSPEQARLLGGEEGVLREGQPVFFKEVDRKLVFFGHTMMLRLPYERTPRDFVPEALRANAITDMAEALFGFSPQAANDMRTARAGRVFVTDAKCRETGKGVWWRPQRPIITPRILAAPRPTTFQHYLTQQQPDSVRERMYDDGTPDCKRYLDHYGDTSPHPTVIRGHKIYWQRGNLEFADVEETDERNLREAFKQYTRIQPVRPQLQFTFRVYFENLTEVELGALLWILRLPKGHNHRLGMGKPYGMGAVTIDAMLHLTDRETTRYKKLFNGGKWALAGSLTVNESQLVQTFEKYVLSQLSETDKRGAAALANTPRIEMLLKLLEWPGPERALTEYMTIETAPRHKPERFFGSMPFAVGEQRKRNKNEFQDRPVLPDALHLEREMLRPPSEENAVGDQFYGWIEKIDEDGSAIVLLMGILPHHCYACIERADWGEFELRAGEFVGCAVEQVGQDEAGVVVLYCRPTNEWTQC